MDLEIADLKVFYQTHIHELKRVHEEQLSKLKDRIRFYERRQADDDYLVSLEFYSAILAPSFSWLTACSFLFVYFYNSINQPNNPPTVTTCLATRTTITNPACLHAQPTTPKSSGTCQAEPTPASPLLAENPNQSLIIIDEDELNCKNESQVIQRIIEEYERRLQEQLALARQDMANELEQQIQVRRVCRGGGSSLTLLGN